MDIRKWFDDSAYSDLIIKLSNSTEVKVHKIILCQANKYLRKLCGPESRFAESKQGTIELKDDDPIALTNVLRHIYSLPLDLGLRNTPEWRFWLDLGTTADKYLVLALSDYAHQKFREVALHSTNGDTIFDILESIGEEMPHGESLAQLADKMREQNFATLLENDRYRAKLESGGTEALWQVIDGMISVVGLKEKRHHLCDKHRVLVFQKPSKSKKLTGVCPFCEEIKGCSAFGKKMCIGDQEVIEERVAWVRE